MTYKQGTTWQATYKLASPKQMLTKFKLELDTTPKWKFLKRLQLKRSIEFWSKL